MTDTSELNGFDPLSEKFGDESGERTIFEAATKRVVQNILKSYTGYFDLFSELVQNALDAVEARQKAGEKVAGRIWVDIDQSNGIVRVTDNGIGMAERELRYCLRPSVSFKNRKESRGHKGVGATFLAYGFGSLTICTKQPGSLISVQLDGGRAWADDYSDTHLRPRFLTTEFDAPELSNEARGTSVRVRIGEGNRPDLSWWNATTAAQWLEILKLRTPLGGVYLAGRRPEIEVRIVVKDRNGIVTEQQSSSVEYIWPHELNSVLPKTQDISDIQAALIRCDGDTSRLPAEFKNLSAIWRLWTHDDLLDEADAHWTKTFTPDDEKLIRQHEMSIYGCFVSSAKSWTEYQVEHLKLRRNPLILKGGLQIASDHMVQGDMSVIPLTSTIGYQANTHVVVHFRDGNPDMGRKVFQPELKSLAEKASRQVVTIFKKFLHLMREDTGAPGHVDTSSLFDWQVAELKHLSEHPFAFSSGGRSLAYHAKPRSEQDVIALFHEAVGFGLFHGLQFIGTSGVDRYDSCVRVHNMAGKVPFFDRSSCTLGIAHETTEKPSRPFVLEYKFDLDGLIADFEKEVKYVKEIDLVVCWSIGDLYKERYRIKPYLVGDEGSSRKIYGTTHALYSEKEKRFEIVALEDFFNFIQRPEETVAFQRTRFKD